MDMDEVAHSVGKDAEKPQFFYAEESQQNNFKCPRCGTYNDIIGRFGYCYSCGNHNGSREMETETERISARISSSKDYKACAKDAVSAIDSYTSFFFSKRKAGKKF
jgi:predicted ATP-dependent serine protease